MTDIERAREVYAQYGLTHHDDNVNEAWLASVRSGAADTSHGVQIALAAIKATGAPALEAEVLRLRGAMETICVHSNTDWDEVTADPLAKIKLIHMTAVEARFGRDGE